jgi:hypothetical protein
LREESLSKAGLFGSRIVALIGVAPVFLHSIPEIPYMLDSVC